MTKKLAFTMAEILLSLTIIGVVAAMTIPTLISNTNGAQFKTAYKKALSTLNQAVLMNVALADTDLSTLKKSDGVTDPEEEDGTLPYLLTHRLQTATEATDFATVYADITALKVLIDDTETAVTDLPDTMYTFADGTALAFSSKSENCTAQSIGCVGFIDVNGTNGPNKVIACDANTGTDTVNCEVSAEGITDIYPVFLYGQTVTPATDAARAVLFGK